jgi:hypothetical protein
MLGLCLSDHVTYARIHTLSRNLLEGDVGANVESL